MQTFTLPPPSELTADGPGDYTSALNEFLNETVQPGTPAEWNDAKLTPYEIYPHKGQIVWLGGVYTNLRCQGATLLGGSSTPVRGEGHLTLKHTNRVSIRSGAIVGLAPRTSGYVSTFEAQSGIRLLSSSHVAVTGMRVVDVWGDAIYAGFDPRGGMECGDVNVTGLVSSYTHRDHVALTAARGWRFDSACVFGRTMRTGVDFEPNSASGMAVDVQFDRCWFGPHHLNWVAAAAAAGTVDQVRFLGCTVNGSNMTTVVKGGGVRSNFVFDGCSTDTPVGNPQGAAFQFTGVENVQVTNCHQSLQTFRPPPPMRVARFTNCTGDIVYSGNTPQDVG